jgi:head-tail adaptor
VIKLGDLRTRVVLLKRRVIEEENGAFTEVWQEGDSVWAEVISCVGREAFGEGWNNLASVQAKYKVTMRFRRGRFARIKWGDITLALLCAPLIDQRRQWMSCLMYVVGENDE